MKKSIIVLLAGLALSPAVADAGIINFGVDITSKGSVAQVGGFYDGQSSNGGNDGYELSQEHRSLAFLINTPGLALTTINRFELFLDAEDINCENGCDGGRKDEMFRVSFYDPLTAEFFAWDTSHRSTMVPDETTFGNHLATPYNQDVDNSFFAVAPSIDVWSNMIRNGSLGVRIDWVSTNGEDDKARFDGSNLQVDYTAARSSAPGSAPISAPVPEPASVLLFGTGLSGLAGVARRRLKGQRRDAMLR